MPPPRLTLKFAVIALFSSLGLVQPARADRLRLDYAVYIGPVTVLEVTIRLTAKAGLYKVDAEAETRGWLAWLLPWQAEAAAEGFLGAQGTVLPIRFRQGARWREVWRREGLSFDDSGTIQVETDPPDPAEERELVSGEQAAGTIDPVSALIAIGGNVANGRGCGEPTPTFDGRRRFDLLPEDLGTDPIPGGWWTAYAGSARLCRLSFKTLGGRWHGAERARFWQTDPGRPERPPVDIWYASLRHSEVPVPVRIESGSMLGMVSIYLAKVTEEP